VPFDALVFWCPPERFSILMEWIGQLEQIIGEKLMDIAGDAVFWCFNKFASADLTPSYLSPRYL
jgi:hypothetical protein